MDANKQYRVPKVLEQIMSWERDFAKEVPFMETPTGLFLGIDFTETEGYFCTPVDSIPFARTGVDGIHYALLTDFRLVDQLDEALVLCVSPMDSDKVRIVARNVYDFLALHLFDELAVLNEYESEEAYLESVRREEQMNLNSEWFDHDRYRSGKERVRNELRQKFKLEPIQQPIVYKTEIRKERYLKIAAPTDDLLGVVVMDSVYTPEQVQLLATVRNLQHTLCTERRVVEHYAEELRTLGLVHEAESLVARLHE